MRPGARVARIGLELQEFVPGQAGFPDLAMQLASGREHDGVVLRSESAKQIEHFGTVEIGHRTVLRGAQ